MEIKNMQDAVMYLQGLNISTNMAIKIYNNYGKHTIEIVVDRLVIDSDNNKKILATTNGIEWNDEIFIIKSRLSDYVESENRFVILEKGISIFLH